MHVEERHLRRVLLGQLHRLAPVAGLRDDVQTRPQPGELGRQPLAQQRLVVGDQARDAGRVHAGSAISARNPRGACSASSRNAAAP